MKSLIEENMRTLTKENENLKEDRNGFTIAIILCFGLIIILGILIGRYERDRDALAGAICEKEYGMEFDKYLNDVVYCKSGETQETYDGVKIKVQGKEIKAQQPKKLPLTVGEGRTIEQSEEPIKFKVETVGIKTCRTWCVYRIDSFNEISWQLDKSKSKCPESELLKPESELTTMNPRLKLTRMETECDGG